MVQSQPLAKPTQVPSKPARENLLLLILLGGILGLFLLWPGDAPFIGDEPMLFELAHSANQNHQLAPCGIMGSVGFAYGPGPTWIYQLFLLTTKSPPLWIVLHVLLMFSVMVAGLTLLSRGLNLSRWFIPVVMLSPYVWFFVRHLWDNSFLLPCSALAFGAYVFYLKSRRGWALLLSIAATMFLPLIHLMALPLMSAIFLHMLLFVRKDLWRLRASLLAVVGVILGLHAGYFAILSSGAMQFAAHQTGSLIDWESWSFALFGGRILSGFQMDFFFGRDWLPDNIGFRAITGISCLGYAVVFLGIALSVQQIWKNRSSLNAAGLPLEMNDNLRAHAALIAVIALVLQIFVCGMSRSGEYAHYYHGLWVIYVFFAWLVIEKMAATRKGAIMVGIYGASLLIMITTMAVLVHQRGGTRDLYGPTIANIFEIAGELGNEPRQDVAIRSFTRSLSLNLITKTSISDNSKRLDGPLLVIYSSEDPRDGRWIVKRARNVGTKSASSTISGLNKQQQ